jgi:eukaryotic-like serine/threonine-protein kinase
MMAVMSGFPRPYGRYVLEERIAMGGMAEIFRAKTATTGFEKRVCIKRILPHFAMEEEFVDMFRDEARTAAKLQHGNIVQVFDFGEIEEGNEKTLFLAMELVDGSDLRRLMDRARKRKIPVHVGEVVQVGIDVCRGLYHAHMMRADDGSPQHIVHRDISPHNIMVSRHGEVKVTDFGIARAAERVTHTSTGIVKGKIAYMSPEQAEGKPFDHRLDQWALGVCMWELLCGDRLFKGDNDATILRKVLSVEVPQPSSLRSDVPPAVEAVIMRALHGDMNQRFVDLRAMEMALTKALYAGDLDPSTADVRGLFARLDEPVSARQTNVAVVADLQAQVAPTPMPSVPAMPVLGGTESFPGREPGRSEVSQVFTSSGKLVQPELSPNEALRQASGRNVQPNAPTVMSDPSLQSAAQGAWEEAAKRSGRNPVVVTALGQGLQTAARDASGKNPSTTEEQRVNSQEGTPATRTLVPASGPEPAYAPQTLMEVPSPSAQVAIAQPTRRRLMPIAATAIIGVGVVAAVVVARVRSSQPTTPIASVEAPVAIAPVVPLEPVAAVPVVPVIVASKPDVAPVAEAVAPAAKPMVEPTAKPAPDDKAARAKDDKPKAKMGTITIEITSGWGTVWEGKRQLADQTPAQLKLSLGKHQLTLKQGGGNRVKLLNVDVTSEHQMISASF